LIYECKIFVFLEFSQYMNNRFYKFKWNFKPTNISSHGSQFSTKYETMHYYSSITCNACIFNVYLYTTSRSLWTPNITNIWFWNGYNHSSYNNNDKFLSLYGIYTFSFLFFFPIQHILYTIYWKWNLPKVNYWNRSHKVFFCSIVKEYSQNLFLCNIDYNA
jgi:hypothetical protein